MKNDNCAIVCQQIEVEEQEFTKLRLAYGLSNLASREEHLLLVHPRLRGAAHRNATTRIETYEDHRIAMSFALAGLRIGGITILDPDCVGKTYPGYWDALRSLGVTLTPAA